MICISYMEKPVRILIDLSEQQLRDLERASTREKLSRTAVIRKAIAAYLGMQSHADADQAFGLWREENVDGLDYQDRLRAEW